MTGLLHVGLGNALMATVLALLVATCARIIRRPAFVHALWLLVLLKLVAMPLWTVTLPGAATADPGSATSGLAEAAGPCEPFMDPDDGDVVVDPPVQAGAAPMPVAESVAAFDAVSRLTHWLAGPGGTALGWLWLGGTSAWFAGIACATRRFGRVLRLARPAPRDWQDEAERLACRLGLPRCPTLRLVSGAVSPMLWAVGRTPYLLFPAELLAKIDATQRAALLVHELAHYRRRDHWVRWLEVVVVGLYWWHPVAWWARRELREAEEQCCDAWVTATLADADRAYATALVQVVTFLSHAAGVLPATASGLGHVRDLRRRLTMIMQGTTPRSLSWAGLLTVVAVGLFWLPLALAQNPAVPGEEQQAPQAKPTDPIDQKIAELDKILRDLKDHKAAAAKGWEQKRPDPAELDKLRDTVKKLASTIENRRRELRESEAQLNRLLTDLAHAEGHDNVQEYTRLLGLAISGGSTPTPLTATLRGYRALAAQPATTATTGQPAVSFMQPTPAYATTKRAVAAGEAQPSLVQLAQQIERLAKEVHDLRSEQQKRQAPAPPAVDMAKALEDLAKQVEELRRQQRRNQNPPPAN